jgi:hypothetical protein
MVMLNGAMAAAQVSPPPEPPRSSWLRLGPVRVDPSISIHDFGVDQNVFNEATNPKQDVTAIITPQAHAWMRLGRGSLQARTIVDLTYFQRYATQRSVNTDTQFTFGMRLGRLTPYVTEAFSNTSQRLNLEIDARAPRTEHRTAVGGKLQVTPRTTVAAEARRTRIDFDPDAVFLGTVLRDVLNRSDDGFGVAVRQAVTPFTTLVAAVDRQETRFPFSPLRNADSLRVSGGAEFNTRALVAGSIYVGRQSFTLIGTGAAPSFEGTVVSAGIGHTIAGSTRVSLSLERSVSYSFEPFEPYYVSTGLGGSATQRITDSWDVHAGVSRYRLAYAGSLLQVPQTDYVWSANGGLGYRLSRRAIFNVGVGYQRRESASALRSFEGLRTSSSATYKF